MTMETQPMRRKHSAFWTVFTHEISRMIGRRSYLITTFGVPVIALAIFFGLRAYSDYQASRPVDRAAEQAAEEKRAQNLNSESSPLRRRPIGIVDQSGLLKDAKPVPQYKLYTDEQAAIADVQNDTITLYYKLAPDYLTTGNISINFERAAFSGLDQGALQRYIREQIIATTGHTVPVGVISRLEDTTLDPSVETYSAGQTTRGVSGSAAFFVPYVFAAILFFTNLIASGYLMQALIEEKENRVVEMLISSVRPRDLLFGKTAALALLGFIQVALWAGVVLFIMLQLAGDALGRIGSLAGFTMTSTQTVTVVAFFILGFILSAAAYTLIGAVANTSKEGPQYAVFFTLPASVPLYALALFSSAPDGSVPTALSLFPLTAPMAMTMRALLTTVPLSQILLSAGLILLTAIGLLWLAARLFRVGLLLSGQSFKFRDLGRLVRERG